MAAVAKPGRDWYPLAYPTASRPAGHKEGMGSADGDGRPALATPAAGVRAVTPPQEEAEEGFEPGDPEREVLLVGRCQAGDRGAFDLLVLAYQDRIYNLAHRLTGDPEEATDLAQETFVKAFQALASFRRDARFSTWIYRIAINACHSRHRKTAVRRRHAPVSLDAAVRTSDGEVAPDPPDTREEPSFVISRSETIRMVRAAIESLDLEHRTVVLLRDMEGYSYEEIQEILGCPIGTVRSRLHRARAELGKRLKRLQA